VYTAIQGKQQTNKHNMTVVMTPRSSR